MADKCVNSNMVYRFYVTRTDKNTTEAYTGYTWNFKRRHDSHMRSMTPDTTNSGTVNLQQAIIAFYVAPTVHICVFASVSCISHFQITLIHLKIFPFISKLQLFYM